MPDLLAVVTLASISGVPKDDCVNTMAFSAPAGFGALAADWDALQAEIAELYNGLATGQQNAISAYLGNSLSRAAGKANTAFYDITGKLDGSPHGSPVAERSWTLGASLGTGDLPREVAFVVTLRGVGWQTALVEVPDAGDPGTEVDRPKARRTGKLYFGPLSAGAGVAAADALTGDVRPSATMQTGFLNAVAEFAGEVKLVAAGMRLCVWSRKDTFLHTVEHVQVDNAFDTQRRRGSAPTLRQTSAAI